MNLKLWIKNNIRYSYIIPLTTKYRVGGNGAYARSAIPVILKTKVIRGKGLTRSVAEDTFALFRCVEIKCDSEQRFFYHIDEDKTIAVKGNVISNFTLDYKKIISGSFRELADQAISVGGKYGANAARIKEGVYLLYKRTRRFLRNEQREDILRAFDGMLDRGARHFDEGLQRILFFNQLMWQTRHRLNGIGRVDRFLDELYRNDIESGYMDEEEAYGLILEFLKCLHRNYEFKSAALIGDIGQIIVLGGLEENGEYFCNDLTYMFMRAHRQLAFPDPKILLRVSEKMPGDLLEATVECLLGRTGSPIFSNDDVIISKLSDFGYDGRDAINYCVSACWEPYIPGKSLDQNNILGFDLAKVFFDFMESADLSKITSYKDLLKAYDRKLHRELTKFVRCLDEYIWAEDPLLSMFMDSCTQRATDISEGGAIYNNYGFTTVGMGAVCNSLLNIRDLCYCKKKYDLSNLEKMREQDFLSAERCFDELKTHGRYFGHDNKDSIALANHIINRCNKTLSGITNRFGGKVKFGLSSPDYVLSGKRSPADFAGRKNGMPYATHISADDAGYTELIGFASQLVYGGCNINGNVTDFFVQPNVILDNREKFVLFMKGAIKRGFYQMQMNIMDSSTLIDAKKNPEKYRNLIVRVWGFSAYFNDLPEEYKDQLIKRALENENRAA